MKRNDLMLKKLGMNPHPKVHSRKYWQNQIKKNQNKVITILINYEKIIVKIIKLYNIQAVIHFAGSAYVGESVKVPRKYYENNTVGTLSLLNSLLETGLTNIVFSSTCSVYGLADDCPITEETPLNPINPYGESKYFIEKILRSYQFAYGLNSISLRYFNAAGSDPDGNLGEEHNPETHLIPLALRACLEPERQLSIFGNNYTTPDGSAIRDYVHVKDLATAHIGAIKYITQKKGSHILNLGTGKGHSVLDVINSSGTYIPQLCKDPDMKPLGACRTCLVQVEGVDGYPASCSLPAKDGLKIWTDSPEVRSIRGGVLEMTLAMFPEHSSKSNKKIGEADYKELTIAAKHHNIETPKWRGRDREPVDESNPISRE